MDSAVAANKVMGKSGTVVHRRRIGAGMFRIRQITDTALQTSPTILPRVQAMLRERLPGISAEEVESLPSRILDPLSSRFKTILLVADDLQGGLKGFAVMSFAPDAKFCLLEYIVAGRSLAGHGIGGALYARVREVARGLGAFGLFFECLPDDPALCSQESYAAQNAARLRFYERYGARPIVNTGYETPLSPGQKDMPHLVFDDLGSGEPLSRDRARRTVRAILERKYAHLCPPGYIETVVKSIVDDPVRLREPRYAHRARPVGVARRPGDQLIALVVNDRHDIHHVRDRGYVEAPVRIKSILDGIVPTGLFWRMPPREFPMSWIRAVHDEGFVEYLRRVCAAVEPGRSVYPYVFPIRNHAKPPKDLAYAAGYYCIDTFTPLNRNAFLAAKRAVDCTLTAASAVLEGQRFAYALVRPPGHHAERRVFGGFCYFCNAGIAAEFFARHGKVAILDIDYHHGNGQQDIFYRRSDVLTVSIHGHPRFAYPFFSGYEDETGEGEGAGFNVNLPLPEQVDGERYREVLRTALHRIRRYGPRFLIVALGFDTGRGDPTGTWSLKPDDFGENARLIARLGLPTLVVQEGGYRTTSLGANARHFFVGLTEAAVVTGR